MKRIVGALLVFEMLFTSFFVMPAYAQTVVQDGIEVTLVTDKENYTSLEVIDARLLIKNTNSTPVKNLQTEITAPDGFMLTSSGATKITELAPGDTQTLQTGMRDLEAEAPALPQTGDNSHGGLWLLLLIVSTIALSIVIVKHRQVNRVISLLLCVALLSAYVPNFTFAYAESNQKTIIAFKQVTVDGEPITITGVVKYDFEEKAETFQYGDFIYEFNDEQTGILIISYIGQENVVVVPEMINGIPVESIADDAFAQTTDINLQVYPDSIGEAFAKLYNIPYIIVGEETQVYTVTWVNHDGTVLETDENVPYGTMPTYDGTMPEKETDEQNSYVFMGWSPEITAVTSEVTYTAQFVLETQTHTVTWENYDGTELEKDENVPFGSMPSYDGEEPVRKSNARYNFVFVGWDPEISAVTGDVVYVAQYELEARTYTVTWVNYDDTVLEIDENVPYGTMPSYNGKTPERSPSDEINGFVFYGWGPKVSAVKSDVVYKAHYDVVIRTYTITWVNHDGTVLEIDENVPYGTMPTYDGAEPEKEMDEEGNQYTFTGMWSPIVNGVRGDITYTAEFFTPPKYTVTWLDWDNTVLEIDERVPAWSVPVYDGSTPTRDDDEQNSYTFMGWDPEVYEINMDTEYIAMYDSVPKTYTVKWVNYDGTLLEKDENVPYGTTPSYDSKEPVKETDEQNKYVFAGWNPEISAVIGSITYAATYDEVPLEDENDQNFIYSIINGEVIIQGYTGNSGNVVIPEKIKGYPVTAIGDEAFSEQFATNNNLISVDIPNTVTRIGMKAFTFCRKLVTVNMPDGVVSIGKGAFSNCNELKSIELPKSLKQIDAETFEGCSSLECIQIPDGVQSVGVNAFTGCSKLTSLILPNSIKSIGSAAFSNCSELFSIEIPEGVKEISDNLFAYCSKLNTVNMPEGIVKIGKYAFTFCENLKHAFIPNSVEVIENSAFAYSGWNSGQYPTNLKKIEDYAFRNCENLSSINLPESVENIGEGTFQYCSNMVLALIPESVVSIGDNAFEGCKEDFQIHGYLNSQIHEYAIQNHIHFVFLDSLKITWVNYDDSVLEVDENVPSGSEHIYNGAVPTREPDKEYTYSFDRWMLIPHEGTNQLTYKAMFKYTTRTYTITWLNYDGTELEVDENVAYGTMPIYYGTDPVKEADEHNSYEFAGWDPLIELVTGDMAYTAKFISKLKTYTVTWLNHDGTELEKDENVPYGTMPIYDGKNPEKAADAENTYIFMGWAPEISEVTGNVTYTAQYVSATQTYTVTWMNHDGTVLETDENVPYGTMPTYDGNTPEKTTDAEYSYAFAGWNPEIAAVTKNVIYTAQFTSRLKTYTITWQNYDGMELEKDENVPYGSMPSYDGSIPEKTADEQYSYAFTDWNPEITAVTGDVTYTAQFKSTTQVYTIIWANYNGKHLEVDENVLYGVAADYNGKMPQKPADEQYFYVFCGWSSEINTDNNVIMYIAQYLEMPNTYEFIFTIADGECTITGYNGNASEVTIPERIKGYPVTGIARSAFEASDFRKISIPSSVTYIGPSAFWKCTNLTEIRIPDGVEIINDGTFNECTNLTSVILPDGLNQIGTSVGGVFGSCEKLKEIKIPDSVRKIAQYSFSNCSGLESIIIPSGVTEIGWGVFANCKNLKNVVLPDTILEIGVLAFHGCNRLESIVIPDNVKTIGECAFRDCIDLKNIKLSKKLEIIDDEAFKGCANLERIIIPYGTRIIGDKAFYVCMNLDWVYIPETVKQMEAFTFYGNNDLVICGRPWTYAETYSNNNRIKFEAYNALDNAGEYSDGVFEVIRKYRIGSWTYYEALLCDDYNGVSASNDYQESFFFLDSQYRVVTDPDLLCKLYTLHMYAENESIIRNSVTAWKNAASIWGQTTVRYLKNDQIAKAFGGIIGSAFEKLISGGFEGLENIISYVTENAVDSAKIKELTMIAYIEEVLKHLDSAADIYLAYPAKSSTGIYDYEKVQYALKQYQYTSTCYETANGLCIPIIEEILDKYAADWNVFISSTLFSFASSAWPKAAWALEIIQGAFDGEVNDFEVLKNCTLWFSEDLKQYMEGVEALEMGIQSLYGGMQIFWEFAGIKIEEQEKILDAYYITLTELYSSQLCERHQLLAQ